LTFPLGVSSAAAFSIVETGGRLGAGPAGMVALFQRAGNFESVKDA
jgi:hypothetical protein